MTYPMKEWRIKNGKAGRPQLTPTEIEQILDMYRNGYKAPAIAKKFDRTTEGIYKILRKNGLK